MCCSRYECSRSSICFEMGCFFGCCDEAAAPGCAAEAWHLGLVQFTGMWSAACMCLEIEDNAMTRHSLPFHSIVPALAGATPPGSGAALTWSASWI